MECQILRSSMISYRSLLYSATILYDICDSPRENWPSSHLVMIVDIPVLKILIGVSSFWSC